MRWALGPCETNQRPSNPRVSQAARDSGLPERSGRRGCTAYSEVWSLRTLNAELAAAKKAREATPLNRVTTSSTRTRNPAEGASSRGIFTQRLS